MRILHICLCGPFTDGLSYQENELVSEHVFLGHDVTVIASTDAFDCDMKIVQVPPGISTLVCGAKLLRLDYRLDTFKWISRKIRAHKRLFEYLGRIRPDRILFHGTASWDLLTVKSYIRKNRIEKFFVDCHSDFNNSARNWCSRHLLHRLFYKQIFRRVLPYVDEVLCVTIESFDFAVRFYGSDLIKTRIFPLGAVIEDDVECVARRMKFRRILGLDDSAVVITQTGKLDETKRLRDALVAFSATKGGNLRFVIAGKMNEAVSAACSDLIRNDERIVYLGWQTKEELKTVLAGSDFFLQPFGQTVTTQLAMGYGCIVLAQDFPSHRWLVGAHGKLFRDSSELGQAFEWVLHNVHRISALKYESRKFASDFLNYRELASRLTF
jgi:1,2-diacylglycerol 3-alpha-glucosyltransferase